MTYGTFEISRQKIADHLSSQNILILSSIPIFFDDQLDKAVGYTGEEFDADDCLQCHVEDPVFEQYCRCETEFRFGYKLNIDPQGSRQIELTSINIVPR
jgi:hypothetical protein